MALTDGLRLGGVYADVGLNFATLDRDLAELKTRLDRAGRGLKVAASAGGGASGGGSFGGAALAIGAMICGEMRRVAAHLSRGLDAVVDQTRRAADALKVVASDSRATQRAAHDLYREQMRQFHGAHATRLFARTAGINMQVDKPRGYAGLPADVRYIAGAGFDQRIQATASAASEAATAATKAATATFAPVVREVIAALPAGRTTRAGGYAMKPGRFTARTPIPTPYDLLEPGQARVARGTMHGAAGVVDMPTNMFGAGAMRELGGTVYESVRRLHAALAGLGHGGMWALGRVGHGMRTAQLHAGRLAESTRLLRAVFGATFNAITWPIQAAARAMGLFDARASSTTNTMRLFGRTGLGGLFGGGMGGGAGGRVAAGMAAGGMGSGVPWGALGMAGLAGFGVAKVGGWVRSAAREDPVTQGLASKAAEGLGRTGEAVGKALQPALQQVLALIVDIQGSTCGMASALGTAFGYVGNAIAQGATFARQVVANWSTAMELVGVVFQQLGENAVTTFQYIVNVAGTLGSWVADNWRSIFADLFNIIQELAANAWANLKIGWENYQNWWNGVFDPEVKQEMKAFVAPQISVNTKAPELPSLRFANSYAGQMGELFAKITSTVLPKPADMVDAANAEGSASRSRVGDLIGASELRDMLQGSASEKKK